MQNFGIRFLLCNLLFMGMIGLLVLCKRLLRRWISPQIQYRLWMILIAALFMPFLPVNLSDFSIPGLFYGGFQQNKDAVSTAGSGTVSLASIPEDFAVSVSSGISSEANIIFLCLWAAGMAAVGGFLFLSWQKFRHISSSALPVESIQVQDIFDSCKSELNVRRSVRLYSTAVLKSPVTAGIFRPVVYLPLHVISDFRKDSLRYILLHELRHCRQYDGLMNLLANFVQIIYWFNPAVWYALKKMRLDRELACDSAVLEILDDREYSGYGHTLLDLAEKISFSSFPFSSGISGSGKQIQLRIRNIVSYHRESRKRKRAGIFTCILVSLFFLSCAPFLSIRASGDVYEFYTGDKNVVGLNLSEVFRGYEGSFVLYGSAEQTWKIYNLPEARKRVAPDSTYKIYAALYGLEEGVISPNDSEMAWDGTEYPFQVWERDQDLTSAIQNSVNWYFQRIDAQLGIGRVRALLQKIHYGNETAGNDLEFYWTDQSLKISPIEQVELLQKLREHRLPFSDENIETVKKALCLGESDAGTFYGKTGTGQMDSVNVNGWFVGFLETSGNIYYFATNIHSGTDASGSKAAEITADVMSEIINF